MSDQITNNPEALRLFFTEDIFLVDAPQSSHEGFNEVNESSIEPGKMGQDKLINAPETFTTSETFTEPVPAAVSASASVSIHPAVSIPAIDVNQRIKPPVNPESIPVAVSIPAIDLNQHIKPPVISESMDAVHVDAGGQQHSPAEQPFSYVGANERNILILVNDDRHPVSTLQGRELLGNILKAINLNRNDCALVNYASCNGATFAQFNDFFKPQYVFAFGVSPAQLGIPAAAYNSIVSQGESKLIFSSNLDALSNDAATKKLLWGSLKQINL